MTRNFAKTVLATALAVGLVHTASAAPADLQVVQSLGTVTTDTVIGDGPLAGGMTFDEFFQFNLGGTSSLGWTVTASIVGDSGVSILSSGLYAGTLSTLNHDASDPASLADGVSFTDFSDPSSPTFWTLDPGTSNLSSLDGGNYTLVISGQTLADNGAFGGVLSVAAVPEPDNYALMAAGAGLLGFVARRRMANG